LINVDFRLQNLYIESILDPNVDFKSKSRFKISFFRLILDDFESVEAQSKKLDKHFSTSIDIMRTIFRNLAAAHNELSSFKSQIANLRPKIVSRTQFNSKIL